MDIQCFTKVLAAIDLFSFFSKKKKSLDDLYIYIDLYILLYLVKQHIIHIVLGIKENYTVYIILTEIQI